MIQEGQKIGDYEIGERIGQSETGAIFKARQISTGWLATISVLDPAVAVTPEFVGRFCRDAAAAAALEHANLLRVYGTGESEGSRFVAMEFVPDESVIARIKRKGRIGPENAIAIGLYLANALDYAWKHAGLIHCEVKPESIFVSREGNVKLGAFGLSKESGGSRPPTSGALHYISPEQAQGLGNIDLRANIYSVGCLLYHMLSGRTPYEGADAVEVMAKHVNEPPPEIRTVWPQCPATLAAVIKRTMQKAPAARYQSYDELGAALRQAYDALGTPAPTVPIARRESGVVSPQASATPVAAPAPTTPARLAVAPRAPAQPVTAQTSPAPAAQAAPATAQPVTAQPVTAQPVTAQPVAAPPVAATRVPGAGTGSPATTRLAPGPPTSSRPRVTPPTARLVPGPSASGRPVAAPPMSVRPVAPPPGTVGPLVENPAVYVNSKKRKLIWAAAILGACVVVGLVLYFALRKKTASDAANPPVEAIESPAGLPKASQKKPFINTLGMQFVPVRGADVLFCTWETRVKDYASYAQATGADEAWTRLEYRGTPVGREPEHPVCGVSWDDATGFCKWLTEKETSEGSLKAGARYRLPADTEWSHAVGLRNEEGATPKERSGKNVVDFPWGKTWPPPDKAGDYADAAYHEKYPKESAWIDGYRDGFSEAAPVGSFAANEFGIYDLGGNVWEWCDDPYEAGSAERVLRGASWIDSDRGYLLASYRIHYPPGSRFADYGFRCVLAPGGAR